MTREQQTERRYSGAHTNQTTVRNYEPHTGTVTLVAPLPAGRSMTALCGLIKHERALQQTNFACCIADSAQRKSRARESDATGRRSRAGGVSDVRSHSRQEERKTSWLVGQLVGQMVVCERRVGQREERKSRDRRVTSAAQSVDATFPNAFERERSGGADGALLS